MADKRRYIVGLTSRERDFVRTAVRYFDEQIENDEHTTPPERAMHDRLLTKLDAATRVTSTQADRFEKAARDALRKAMR